ncbi:MAG: sialidase family protein, partial [Myxococcota bacterium]|nr:sialidase family protein [Myxococcota bacterium]
APSAVAVCADAVTGELYGVDQSGGVRLSTDQGVSFEVVGSIETSSPSLDCEVMPNGDLLILESNYCGDVAEDPCSALWRSVDGGASFTQAGQAIANGAGGTKASMTVAPDGQLYAVGGANEVYTCDGQDLAVWTLAGVVDTGSGKEIQVMAAGADGALYAATPTYACVGDCDAATVGGHFFVSQDHGATWSKGAEDWTSGGSGSGWVGLVVSKYPPQGASD